MSGENWKRRALLAESRYEQLRDEVSRFRTRSTQEIIEMADHRHYKTQVRILLVEAIEFLDAISESDS